MILRVSACRRRDSWGINFATTTPRIIADGIQAKFDLTQQKSDRLAPTIEYNADIRSDFQSHTGLLKGGRVSNGRLGCSVISPRASARWPHFQIFANQPHDARHAVIHAETDADGLPNLLP